MSTYPRWFSRPKRDDGIMPPFVLRLDGDGKSLLIESGQQRRSHHRLAQCLRNVDALAWEEIDGPEAARRIAKIDNPRENATCEAAGNRIQIANPDGTSMPVRALTNQAT